MSGPVQVLVVTFEQPAFDGSVLAELDRLKEAGVVRLVDLLVLTRSEDGGLETIEVEGYGAVAAELLGGGDSEPAAPAGDDLVDAWGLDEVVPDSGITVVALLEHLWAESLGAAIRGVGGTSLVETWLSEQDRSALAALEGSAAR